MPTYQGTNGPAGSALGSLLRKIEEERQAGPHRTPQTSQDQSPIREAIQAPLETPESVGSSKMVSMKPEMAVGSGVVPPISATPPGAGGNAVITPPPAGAVVGPTIPAPILPSGVANPQAQGNPQPSQTNTPPQQSAPSQSQGGGKVAGATTTARPSNVSVGPTSSGGLLPSGVKNIMNQPVQSNGATISAPSSNGAKEAAAAGGAAAASGGSSFLRAASQIGRSLLNMRSSLAFPSVFYLPKNWQMPRFGGSGNQQQS